MTGKHLPIFLFFTIMLVLGLSACAYSPMQASATPFEILPSSTPVSATATVALPTATPIPATPTSVPTALPSLTATPKGCGSQEGHVIEEHFKTFNGTVEESYLLYTPPCYSFDKDKKYPLLILLHGSNGDQRQWIDLGLAKEMDAAISTGMPPFLVAMPTITNVEGNLIMLTNMLGVDLINAVDHNYRILNDKAHLAIGGLSYGAIWAQRTVTQKPEVFGKLGLHSTAIEMESVLSFLEAMRKLPLEERPAIYIDTGVNDMWNAAPIAQEKVLNDYRIAHTWVFQPGAHTPEYWSKHLPEYLRFYSQGWTIDKPQPVN